MKPNGGIERVLVRYYDWLPLALAVGCGIVGAVPVIIFYLWAGTLG